MLPGCQVLLSMPGIWTVPKMIQVSALLGQGVGKKPSKPITQIIYGSDTAVQPVRG